MGAGGDRETEREIPSLVLPSAGEAEAEAGLQSLKESMSNEVEQT